MENITAITDMSFKAIITAALIAILRHGVPLLIEWLEKTASENLDYWTDAAVTAAEKSFAGRGRGKEKLQFALGYLENKGLKADEVVVSAKANKLFGGK